MVDVIKACSSLEQLNGHLEDVKQTQIGKSGGRKIIIDGQEHSINKVIKKFLQLCEKTDYSKDESIDSAVKIADKLSQLSASNEYKKDLSQSKKVKLKVKQTFGNVFGYGSSSRTPSKLKSQGFKKIYKHNQKVSKSLLLKLQVTLFKYGMGKTNFSEIETHVTAINDNQQKLVDVAKKLDPARVAKIEKDSEKIKTKLSRMYAFK